MMSRTAVLGLTILIFTACAVDDGAAPSETGELENRSGGVHTASQAKQVVVDLWNTLGTGDLDGYIAGLSDDVEWNVNSAFLPWGLARATVGVPRPRRG